MHKVETAIMNIRNSQENSIYIKFVLIDSKIKMSKQLIFFMINAMWKEREDQYKARYVYQVDN